MPSSLRTRLRSPLRPSRTRTAILIAASLVAAVALSGAGAVPPARAEAALPANSTVPGGAVLGSVDDERALLTYGYQIVLGPDGRPWFPSGNTAFSIDRDGALVEHDLTGPGRFAGDAHYIYAAVDHRMWLPTADGMAVVGADDLLHVVATPPGQLSSWQVTGDGRAVVASYVAGQSYVSWITPDGQISTYPKTPDFPASLSDLIAGPQGSLWRFTGTGAIGKLPDGTSATMVLPADATDLRIYPGDRGGLYVTYLADGRRTLARVEASGASTPVATDVLSAELNDGELLYATAGTDGRITFNRVTDPTWQATLPTGFTLTTGRCWQPSTGSLWTAGKYAGDQQETLVQLSPSGAVPRLHGGWYGISACKTAPDGSVWSPRSLYSQYFHASGDGSVVYSSSISPNAVASVVVSDDGSAWVPIQNSSGTAGIGHLSFAMTDRTAGGDRFEGAAKVSAAAFPSGAPVAYLVSGLDFPDALAAGPAAAKQGGPLLLTTGGALPSSTADELKRLRPSRVVLVGGTTVVAPAVERAVRSLLPSASVEREGGGNRFATGQLVVRSAFTTAAHVYVAAGGAFPDALSASAVAGASSSPVVLVDGRSGTLDAETRALIAGLSPSRITLVGGQAAVSAGIMADLTTVATTDRVAGGDRFDTSAALARSAFPNAKKVFVASGVMFPDALSGAVWAASVKAPLVTSMPGCLPASTEKFLGDAGTTHVSLLGGINALAPALDGLTAC